MSIDVPELADLEEVRGRWRTAVAGVLSKSTRKDPEQLGDQPEQLLEAPTYDGIAVRALYTVFDELPEPPLPGEWPYVRGGDALRDVKSGWKVAEAFPAAGTDGADANAAVLDALGVGVSALLIRIGDAGLAPDQLEGLLAGVHLSMAPVILDAGTDYAAACDAMLALVDDVAADQRATVSLDLGADPLTAALSGRPAPTMEEVVAVATRVAGVHGVRAITVDGPAFHNLGANATWELAGGIAAAVAYLRVLTESGLSVGEALGQISFRLAADDDQFMTLAKMRALRQLWARVAEVAGDPGGGAAVLHAETSLPMMTQRDPWVNMLRCTLAAFGAGVGGADTVLVFPFDIAIPGGFPGTARSFARRIARNTQLLLLEESHVGRVLDPAGGSWFVEDLTEQLAQQAWQRFQEIEARGGFVDAGDYLADQIAEIATRRADDVAHRRTAITGVNEFPNLAEPALPQIDAECRWPAAIYSATPPDSRRCGTAPTSTWPAAVHVRARCCCRWARWPRTTFGPRSRPTYWRRAASSRSTRERSVPPMSPRPSRSFLPRGRQAWWSSAVPTGVTRTRSRGLSRRRELPAYRGFTWQVRSRRWGT